MAHQRIEMGAVLLAMMTVLWARAAAQSSSSCTSAIISMAPCLNYINGNSATPSSGCCTQLANVVRTQPQCLCQVLNGGGTSLGIKVNQTQALALPGACNVQTPPTSRCNAASPSAPPASPSAPAASPVTPAASPAKPASPSVPAASPAAPASLSAPAASPAKPASPSVPAASPAKPASLSTPAASPAKPASPSAPAASPAMPAASPTESPAGTPESPNTTSSGTGSKTAPSTQSSISDASATRMTISLLFFSLFVASYASTSRIC